MTNYTPGYDRSIPKNLVEMAHDETGQRLSRDELETWVFRRFQRLEQQIKRLEEEHEAKVIQNAHLMRERDAYRTAEECQIAVRQKIEQERDALAAHVERLRNACQMAFQTPLDEHYSKGVNVALHHAIESTGENNLDRRDTLKQAEGWEQAAHVIEIMECPKGAQFFREGVVNHLRYKAEKMRRQAEAHQ